MKINYSDYIKKTDASVLVAEAIFSELMLLYPLKSIEDVANTTSGGTPLRSNYEYYGGNIPWLKSGELNDGIIDNAEEFITEKGLANSSAKLHPKNTLLLAMYGATAGRTGITTMESSTNQAVCALFPKVDLNQGYLFWFLRQYRYKFIEISKGGAQPNISQSVIKATKLPIPNVELQVEISELLFRLENGGELDLSLVPIQFRDKVDKVFSSKNNVFEINLELNNQLDLVKQLRQSFLREAMQGKLLGTNERTEENQETGQQLLEKIKAEKAQLIKDKKLKKEKELPPIKPEEIPFEIPEDWVWCRFNEIANIESNLVSPFQYPNHPHLAPDNIEKNTGKLFPLKTVLEDEVRSANHYFYPGHLIYSKVRPKLNKIVKVDFEGLCSADMYPIKALIDSDYLQYCMLSEYFLIEVDKFDNRVKMPKINQDQLSQILIPIAPYKNQILIAKNLRLLLQTCDELEASIKHNQQQNEQLLQQVLREALEVEEVGI